MPRRSGFSLVELVAVMAAMVVLGGVLVPTLAGISRDTNVKAAADLLRGRVAEARAHAIGHGRAYRLSVATDGTRVRVAPADAESSDPATAGDEPAFHAEDAFPVSVHATPVATSADPGMSDGGWVGVATFLPDGTCREDSAELDLSEPGCYSMRLTVRGLTGSATLTPVPVSSQGTAP